MLPSEHAQYLVLPLPCLEKLQSLNRIQESIITRFEALNRVRGTMEYVAFNRNSFSFRGRWGGTCERCRRDRWKTGHYRLPADWWRYFNECCFYDLLQLLIFGWPFAWVCLFSLVWCRFLPDDGPLCRAAGGAHVAPWQVVLWVLFCVPSRVPESN